MVGPHKLRETCRSSTRGRVSPAPLLLFSLAVPVHLSRVVAGLSPQPRRVMPFAVRRTVSISRPNDHTGQLLGSYTSTVPRRLYRCPVIPVPQPGCPANPRPQLASVPGTLSAYVPTRTSVYLTLPSFAYLPTLRSPILLDFVFQTPRSMPGTTVCHDLLPGQRGGGLSLVVPAPRGDGSRDPQECPDENPVDPMPVSLPPPQSGISRRSMLCCLASKRM